MTKQNFSIEKTSLDRDQMMDTIDEFVTTFKQYMDITWKQNGIVELDNVFQKLVEQIVRYKNKLPMNLIMDLLYVMERQIDFSFYNTNFVQQNNFYVVVSDERWFVPNIIRLWVCKCKCLDRVIPMSLEQEVKKSHNVSMQSMNQLSLEEIQELKNTVWLNGSYINLEKSNQNYMKGLELEAQKHFEICRNQTSDYLK